MEHEKASSEYDSSLAHDETSELGRSAIWVRNQMTIINNVYTLPDGGFPITTDKLIGLNWLHDARVVFSIDSFTKKRNDIQETIHENILTVAGTNVACQTAYKSYVIAFDQDGNWLPIYSKQDQGVDNVSEEEQQVRTESSSGAWQALVKVLAGSEEEGFDSEAVARIFDSGKSSITSHELEVMEKIIHQITKS